MKLYIYEHCPFCARVRYVAGMLNIPLDIVAIDYDDDQTTTELVGSKQVPVLVKDDGTAMVESLDIIKYFLELANENESYQPSEAVLAWQKSAFLPVQKIGYPRWAEMDLPEFNKQSAKDAWRAKKETEALNFDQLLASTDLIVTEVNQVIKGAVNLLKLSAQDAINYIDRAVIFSILRSFYSEPTVEFAVDVDQWMQLNSEASGVRLLK